MNRHNAYNRNPQQMNAQEPLHVSVMFRERMHERRDTTPAPQASPLTKHHRD